MWLIQQQPGAAGGEGWRYAFRLNEGSTVIGRGTDCDLVVNDGQVSRRHVRVDVVDGSVSVTDAGSTTGTFVNGERRETSALIVGDGFTIGATKFRLVGKLPSVDGSTSDGADGPSNVAVGDEIPPDGFHAFLQALVDADSPQRTLRNLLQGLVTVFNADRGFVLGRGDGADEMALVAAHEVADSTEFVAVSSTVYNRALDGGSPVHVANSATTSWLADARTVSHFPQPRAILCAPLTVEGTPWGVIYLDRKVRAGAFSSTAVALFESVTAVAASLLEGRLTRTHLSTLSQRMAAFNAFTTEGHQLVTGSGDRAAELRRLIETVAPQDVSVMVTGETGTGKEVVARAIHRLSKRRAGPFVAVNCAALSADIIAAELFGHEKGAFTGALDQRIGKFELASGGTLFLDEVGDVPIDVQVKLLRVLQERQLTRLGGNESIPVDFRLVCATNIDLEAAVREGAFRKDLYYRINVFRIELRPLRDRPEDILPLARHFLADFALQMGRPIKGFTAEAERALTTHAWPGNVRELRNAVERAVVIETGEMVRPGSLPGGVGVPSGVAGGAGGGGDEFWSGVPDGFDQACECFQRRFLERMVQRYQGNMSAVARAIGVARSTLYRNLTKLGIATEQEEP